MLRNGIACLCLVLAGLAGCVTKDDLRLLDQRLSAIDDKLDGMKNNQQEWNARTEKELRLGWANALCRNEVRQLIADVKKGCKGATQCKDQKIALAVNVADPNHEGRFITLMDSQRHEVFYLPGDLLDPPQGSKRNRKRLLQFIDQPSLPTTQFLVVSNSGVPSEVKRSSHESKDVTDWRLQKAEARGKVIVKEMLDDHVPADRILLWVFGFDVQKNEVVRKDDRPPPGIKKEDAVRPVWVFRVDCLGQDEAAK